MANVGIGFGIVLVLLGVGAYLSTGAQSVTALIPTFFGIPLAALGFMARDERRLKLAMHVSTVLALLGFLGSARGIPGPSHSLLAKRFSGPLLSWCRRSWPFCARPFSCWP